MTTRHQGYIIVLQKRSVTDVPDGELKWEIATKTIFPKELSVQSAYEQAGNNDKEGRLNNVVEKERQEKRG